MALRYLALGDSYTIGEGVAVEDRWPMQLVRALRAAGMDIADPQIIATTGWTTDELDAGIDAAAPQGPFDLVTLLIGVNNQYRGRSVDEYRTQFAALLQRALGFAGQRARRVLVLAIPDWGVTPFAAGSGRDVAQIAHELDTYNAAAAAVCTQHGIAFIDTAPVSRARGGEVAMLAEDGLHPSAALYTQWYQQAYPVAYRHLNDEVLP